MADDPAVRFRRWFNVPIAKLKELPTGDGAIAAMMIVLPLYERAIIGREKLFGRDTKPDKIQNAMAQDLNLTDKEGSKFWAIYRVGLMHQAMPQAGNTKWMISSQFGATPTFQSEGKNDYVCIDPWKFAERVLAMYENTPGLITASESFPLASIFALTSTGDTES